MGCSRRSLIKLAPVNSINVCKLVFVSVFGTCFNFNSLIIFSGRWTAEGISYKHYCHFLTTVKLFVAQTSNQKSNQMQMYIAPYIASESEALWLGLDRRAYVKQFYLSIYLYLFHRNDKA